MKSLLITEFGFNGTNCSMDQIDIKDEPLRDELVSEFYNKAFSIFLLGWNKYNMFPQLDMLYRVNQILISTMSACCKWSKMVNRSNKF